MSALYNFNVNSSKNFASYQKCFRMRWWLGLRCFDFTDAAFLLTGYEKDCFEVGFSKHAVIYRFTMVKQD